MPRSLGVVRSATNDHGVVATKQQEVGPRKEASRLSKAVIAELESRRT